MTNMQVHVNDAKYVRFRPVEGKGGWGVKCCVHGPWLLHWIHEMSTGPLGRATRCVGSRPNPWPHGMVHEAGMAKESWDSQFSYFKAFWQEPPLHAVSGFSLAPSRPLRTPGFPADLSDRPEAVVSPSLALSQVPTESRDRGTELDSA